MQPPQNRPAIRIDSPSDTQPFDTVGHVAARHQTAVAMVSSVPPKLAKMLLPGERVTFGTAVHPVVLVAPVVLMVLIPLALAVALHWTIRHDGVRYPLIPVSWANAALVAAAVPWAFSLMLLIKRAARFWGLRIVATNRRIFAIRGIIVRRITPLGNTALAGSTLSQGFFGRMFGYGSIDLPLAEGTPERFRDMRDALELYREFQAVANGVDGETWTPAVRQTIIP